MTVHCTVKRYQEFDTVLDHPRSKRKIKVNLYEKPSLMLWAGIAASGMRGGIGGLGALTSAASIYGMNRGLYGAGVSPYGGLGSYGQMSYPGVLGGTQPCNLMQQCFNGQICVNGYCSKSNVAYSGSQIMPTQIKLFKEMVFKQKAYKLHNCKKGQLNSHHLTACHNGVSCPGGMSCHIGRCISNGIPMFGKK
uniref:EB domain-containing protein n=1 Tax=Heterorhabditis bacteriophora TaxID=37862 RepID=A0A1I7WRK7_HETBA